MNRYETIFIVDADVGAEDQKVIFERVNALIEAAQATLLEFDDWGVKKLAYEIKKKKQGHYVRLDYCGTGELINEIERMFRHDHRILRFMTVNLDVNVDPESLKAGMESPDEGVEAPAQKDDTPQEKADENTSETQPKTQPDTADSSDKTENTTDTSDEE